jgi:hypothetical protein
MDYDGGWRGVVVRTRTRGEVVVVRDGGYFAPKH